ncbi:MAG: TIGR03960 family B12-binding radical SAM protein [Deltaproteobacteria bacterium]|nr:TIGR03960 family B12-binding radical SAM protein [Deltaproteobacteria bacterium]
MNTNIDTFSKIIPLPERPWFSKIERPSRYLGDEINAIKKNPSRVELSVALAFPDVYEVGMSHLGLKILYHILNATDWIAAERVFCPWVDMEKACRENKVPLTALESSRPLFAFDIVGFSLQNELAYTNVLTMLDLAGIPFRAEERSGLFPLIIAGGPACFNPEPVADLFDAIVIWDGEEVLLEICTRLRQAKHSKRKDKKQILADLTTIRGIYVPGFYRIRYQSDGIIEGIHTLHPAPEQVEKAVIADIDRHPFPTSQVVPFTELIHDRMVIEISRGCTRGCRFCQAGMVYRPVRERPPESVIRLAEMGLMQTGFGELSLLSLSAGDYSCISPLLKILMENQSGKKVAVSFPSLRIDSLDPEWFDQIKKVRKTGFTLAPEAGNDCLRRKINKPLTNQDILKTAQAVYAAGWHLIKLYFMIGLPGETRGDIRDIIDLSKEIVRLAKGRVKRAKLNISAATFVPKAHTPFMWAPQLELEESIHRINMIRDALRRTPIQVKWNQPEMSWLEGIFARGDRRLTPVLIDAWRAGARFDAWGEHYNIRTWINAFQRAGLDPGFYLYRGRHFEEILPWDHIKSGVTNAYLKNEWERAMEKKPTPDCRKKCLECGVCDHKLIDPVITSRCPTLSDDGSDIREDLSPSKTIRLFFSKTGNAGYLSHLELNRVFIRALRRSGSHLVFSKGFHPMPKISFLSALPVGMQSLHEIVDIQIHDTLPLDGLKDKINRQLPSGICIEGLQELTPNMKGIKPTESHFEVYLDGFEVNPSDLDAFLGSDDFPVVKKGKKGEKTVNARALVKSMSLHSPQHIHLVLRHMNGPTLNPGVIVKHVFHLEEDHTSTIKVLKTKQLMG